MQVFGHRVGQSEQLIHPGPDGLRAILRAFQGAQPQLQRRDALSRGIVQVAAQGAAFLLLELDQPPGERLELVPPVLHLGVEPRIMQATASESATCCASARSSSGNRPATEHGDVQVPDGLALDHAAGSRRASGCPVPKASRPSGVGSGCCARSSSNAAWPWRTWSNQGQGWKAMLAPRFQMWVGQARPGQHLKPVSPRLP